MVGILSGLSFGYGVLGRVNKRVATILAVMGLIAFTAGAQARDVRIAALGDSLTQGYGLMQADGFTAQLQAWLDARAIGATVVNAGVSGDTTTGGLARVDWTLTPDIDAMIVALGGNDVLRGIDPEVARANLTGIMEAAKARDIPVLIIGIGVPGNYGEDYRAAFEAIYPDLAAQYDALYVENFLGALVEKTDSAETLARFMQSDGIHPNAAGVRVIIDAIGPVVGELAARVEGHS
ncbi:arylesterase [Celeribacter arenosi]